MSFIADAVFDAALQYFIDNGSRVDICSQEPANYTEATSTYSLGNGTSVTVGTQADGAVSGRRVTVPALDGETVTATGTATHQALSKTTATTALLAAEALSSSQAVTMGNPFDLTAWDIEFPDP